MAVIERLTSRIEQRFGERERLPQGLHQLLPTDIQKDVLDIDFHDWVQNKGIDTLLLDAEGTLLATDTWTIDHETRPKIEEARKAGIKNIAIVSNKIPKDPIKFLKMTWWAKQIGADVVFTPLRNRERKPSPLMMLKALSHFGVSADQALVVGDKASADILAANRAGIRSVLVDKRMDEEDNRDYISETLFRDPVEHLWYGIVQKIKEEEGLPERPPESEAAKILAIGYLVETDGEEDDWHPIRYDPEELLATLDSSARIISGYGAAEVKLPRAVLAAVPDAYNGIGQQFQTLLADPRYQEFSDTLGKHFQEHGQLEADALTMARFLLTGATVYFLHKKKYGFAFLSELIADLTDFEGNTARRDPKRFSVITEKLNKLLKRKKGKEVAGDTLDPLIDKAQSIGDSIVLTLQGDMDVVNFALQTARDIDMTQERNRRKNEGKFASAVWSGKASTPIAMAARLFSILGARKYPKANIAVQGIATGAKLASRWHTKQAWDKIDIWRKSDEMMAERVKERLAA